MSVLYFCSFQLKDVVLQLSDELNNLKSCFEAKEDDDCLLICRTPLEDFYAEEEKFQEAVTNFTRLLFAEVTRKRGPSPADEPFLTFCASIRGQGSF